MVWFFSKNKRNKQEIYLDWLWCIHAPNKHQVWLEWWPGWLISSKSKQERYSYQHAWWLLRFCAVWKNVRFWWSLRTSTLCLVLSRMWSHSQTMDDRRELLVMDNIVALSIGESFEMKSTGLHSHPYIASVIQHLWHMLRHLSQDTSTCFGQGGQGLVLKWCGTWAPWMQLALHYWVVRTIEYPGLLTHSVALQCVRSRSQSGDRS